MKRFKRILVATDTRYRSHAIVEAATEIARDNSAKLTIVDVVPEFSWTVRMSLNDHAHMRELIASEKQQKLDQTAGPIRESGLDVTTQVLMGGTSLEIVREVMRGDHDLVMRVAKGKDSRQRGPFGKTAHNLLRSCPCALWLVTPDAPPQFRQIVGCVDTSSENPSDEELNRNIVELGTSIAGRHDGQFSLVHAWSIWNESMLKSRLSESEFGNLQHDSYRRAVASLDTFVKNHHIELDPDSIHVVKGTPGEVIPEFCRGAEADLVVMGTVARSGVHGILIGNTAERLLDSISCSVLALKPSTFRTPIKTV